MKLPQFHSTNSAFYCQFISFADLSVDSCSFKENLLAEELQCITAALEKL